MDISKDDLNTAATEVGLPLDRADDLWRALEARAQLRPRFDLVHLLYYAGAALVVGGMAWLIHLWWDVARGGAVVALALAYGAAFLLLGARLWRTSRLRTAGGLLITMAVCMVPLAVYGLERYAGVWRDVPPGGYQRWADWARGGWCHLEVSTFAAGLLALRRFRFPFLTAPLALVVWFAALDVTPLVLPPTTMHATQWVSVAVGLAMLAVSYAVDRREQEDLAFWGYLWGLVAFWGGLSLLDSGSEARRLVYFGINVALMFLAVLLGRRAFLVFGAAGASWYVGHLMWDVFRDSVAFPFVLTLLGLAVLGAGIAYQRRRAAIDRAILDAMPDWVLRLRPPRRQ